MPAIGFFRHARFDGGLRTGMGIDDQSVLEEFQAGDEVSDPALLWYVDVSIEGDNLPSESREARSWLLNHATPIVTALREVAEHLEVGLDDAQSRPYRQRIKNLARSVRGEIRVSGVRRLTEGELSRNIRDLADNWNSTLNRLSPMTPV